MQGTGNSATTTASEGPTSASTTEGTTPAHRDGTTTPPSVGGAQEGREGGEGCGRAEQPTTAATATPGRNGRRAEWVRGSAGTGREETDTRFPGDAGESPEGYREMREV